MKFIVDTKALKNALNLCIIKSNISKYYSRSLLVQITANKGILKINHAANLILSQVSVHGSDDGGTASILVSSSLFKQLIDTLYSSEIELEFTDNTLIIHSGKSTFNLPKLMDISEAQLPTPGDLDKISVTNADTISKTDWKFIKDHQLFALANTYINPIYTYVWMCASGDVLTGDFVNSVFTHSAVSQFGETCLLTDTVISLFANLPGDTKLLKHDNKYTVFANTADYDYLAEFTPLYESDDTGDYNSEIIMNMMMQDEDNTVSANISDINTVLNQVALMSDSKNEIIKCDFDKEKITFSNSTVNCVIPVNGNLKVPYTITFKSAMLKSAISNCPSSQLSICPVKNEDEIVGISIKSGNLSVVIAGVE